jgi:hypothetical protein
MCLIKFNTKAMKQLIYIYLLISCDMSSSQINNNHDLNKLFEQLPIAILPFNSKMIDDDQNVTIDKSYAIKFLLQNDSSKLSYDFHYYDNDNQKNMVKKATYHYYAIGKREIEKLKILLYCRYGNSMEQYIIATFLNNQIVDNLIFGYSEGGGETEITKYTEGEIQEDYTIKMKASIWNPEYTEKKRKENPDFPRSLITLSQYKINTETGKINLISSQNKYSKCIPEEFSYKDSNCELFDN